MAISSVTQITSKSTAVIMNKLMGKIVMNAAALNDATAVSFTVTNSKISASDVVVVNHSAVATLGVYSVQAHTIADGSFKIRVRNESGGSLSEAIALQFRVLRYPG